MMCNTGSITAELVYFHFALGAVLNSLMPYSHAFQCLHWKVQWNHCSSEKVCIILHHVLIVLHGPIHHLSQNRHWLSTFCQFLKTHTAENIVTDQILASKYSRVLLLVIWYIWFKRTFEALQKEIFSKFIPMSIKTTQKEWTIWLQPWQNLVPPIYWITCALWRDLLTAQQLCWLWKL